MFTAVSTTETGELGTLSSLRSRLTQGPGGAAPGRRALTLLIPGQHPDLDVGQRQEGDGLRNPLLKLVLDGCRTQQLKTPHGLRTGESRPKPPGPPQPTVQPVPPCRSPPPRTRWPACPPGCPGPGWPGAVSGPSPRSTLRPGPCTPGPGSAALPRHTPGDRAQRVSRPRPAHDAGPAPQGLSGHLHSGGPWWC